MQNESERSSSPEFESEDQKIEKLVQGLIEFFQNNEPGTVGAIDILRDGGLDGYVAEIRQSGSENHPLGFFNRLIIKPGPNDAMGSVHYDRLLRKVSKKLNAVNIENMTLMGMLESR